MIQSLIGKKLGQTQGFLENGARIPMTRIWVKGNIISQIKTTDKEGYDAIQLGFGDTKKADKPSIGHAKKAGLKLTPHFYRETKADKIEDHEIGSEINVEEVLTPGDIVDVTGVSKGKGFAGVVKRHHFKGGPKTHGQSDRHRAPGSIGQSTTPGRVYKGKRMAGRMGNSQVTIKNLEVIELKDGEILVKGLIPGPIGTIVTLTRRGINKKHIGLFKEPTASEIVINESIVEEIGPSVEEQELLRQEVEAKADKEEKEEALALQNINQAEETELKEGVSKDSEGETSSVSKDEEEAESSSVLKDANEEASDASEEKELASVEDSSPLRQSDSEASEAKKEDKASA